MMPGSKCGENSRVLARLVGSTCTDGLLAPGVWDGALEGPVVEWGTKPIPYPGRSWFDAESCRATLAQVCNVVRGVNDSTLWRAAQGSFMALMHHQARRNSKVNLGYPIGYSVSLPLLLTSDSGWCRKIDRLSSRRPLDVRSTASNETIFR